jgi:hypothetical protein
MQEVKAEICSIKRKNDKVDNKVKDNKVIKNTVPKKKRVRFY